MHSKHDHHARTQEFFVGQSVMAKNLQPGPDWVPGMIVELFGPVSYLVETSSSENFYRSVMWTMHLKIIEHSRCHEQDQSSAEAPASSWSGEIPNLFWLLMYQPSLQWRFLLPILLQMSLHLHVVTVVNPELVNTSFQSSSRVPEISVSVICVCVGPSILVWRSVVYCCYQYLHHHYTYIYIIISYYVISVSMLSIIVVWRSSTLSLFLFFPIFFVCQPLILYIVPVSCELKERKIYFISILH